MIWVNAVLGTLGAVFQSLGDAGGLGSVFPGPPLQILGHSPLGVGTAYLLPWVKLGTAPKTAFLSWGV